MKSARKRLAEAAAALSEAASYDEWLAAAQHHDHLTGADEWQADDDSPFYDAAVLRGTIDDLRRLRMTGRGLELASVLTEVLYRDLSDISTRELYQLALSGPKHLVGRYLDEAECSLQWLAANPIAAFDEREKLRRFEEAWRVFGHSALMLSGGATLGFHHLGVVKALFEQGLLPHILSGASTGAMIAAGICTRNDAELAAMYADTDQIRLDGLAMVGVRRTLSAGALLDPAQLHEVLRHNVGNSTFAEAFAHSGRALNISVSPTRSRQKPRLLNHFTAPDVRVASAALASSALPGLFPPVGLEARGPFGGTVPYIPGERWVDGSLFGDLPKRRLARLHNVNHFIVSQANPHVLPFVRHPGQRGIRPALASVTGTTLRTQGALASDIARRATGSAPAGVRRVAESAYALTSQEYGGDIDIHPRFHWSLFRKMVSNPSREDLADFIAEGERSVWPLVPIIRDQTRIGRAFRTCVERLRASASE